MVESRKPSTREKGRHGEDLAARELQRMGLRILTRNFSTRFGEIDIVAEDSGELVFVEVRSLKTSSLYFPEETIGPRKQQRLTLAAQAYIQQHRMEDRVARFDVVAVETGTHPPVVRHLPDAFLSWED